MPCCARGNEEVDAGAGGEHCVMSWSGMNSSVST